MAFLGDQVPATNTLQKAYINHVSAPFMPDLIAIEYHILRLDAQQRLQGQQDAAPLPPA